MTLTIEQLADRARTAVSESGLTHAAAAERIGVARATLSQALGTPSTRHARIYEKVLGELAGETWSQRREWVRASR